MLPQSIVGTRVSSLLVRIGVDIDVGGHAVALSEDELLAEVSDRLDRLQRDLRGSRVVVADAQGEHELFVLLERESRRWSLQCAVSPEPPHPLIRADVERALPEGIEVRLARPEDNEAILEVCRNTPIVLGDAKLTIDPGDDYFELLRLMDQAASLVATHHGRVVAVQCGTAYEVRFAGVHQRMSQVLHTRVLPEFAGMGLFSVLQRAMSSGEWVTGPVRAGRPRSAEQEAGMRRIQRAHAAAGETGDAPAGGRASERKPLALNACSYFAAENEAILRTVTVPTWKCKPYRVVLACTAADGPSGPGRPATPADASRIVAIINAAHDGEELFLEYTEEFLRARLERSPAYTWANVLVSDHAVVGVWHAGQRRTYERAAAVETSVRSLALDYGFEPGHEDDFVALLVQARGVAAEGGATHVSIFTSDPSPGSSALREMASSVERYEVATPFTREPEGTLERGVYVDQMYF